MDNQHKLIKGYRDLSQDDINLMNEVKSKAEEVGKLVDKVLQHISDQYEAEWDKSLLTGQAVTEEIVRLDLAEPSDWVLDARKDLQVAFMKLVRSVAQPTTF